MLETLISSKTRIKLLVKFFLNSQNRAHLRGLESEFGESSNAIRQELNRFEHAGMLVSEHEGNKKIFRANTSHPLFEQVHQLLLKHLGIDQVMDNVIRQLGDVEQVFLAGDFAKGKNSQVIDLIIIGMVDKGYLLQCIERAEKLIQRKIRFLLYEPEEYSANGHDPAGAPLLLLYSK